MHERKDVILVTGEAGVFVLFVISYRRFDPETPYRSTICTLSDGVNAVEPPSLAASGSACDYRKIPHEKYDCPAIQFQQMALDLAHAHATRVHADDVIVEAG
jgi:hypothetical protein